MINKPILISLTSYPGSDGRAERARSPWFIGNRTGCSFFIDLELGGVTVLSLVKRSGSATGLVVVAI